MDPHAIKLNALRADVADKLTAKFAEFSSALTSEMEALLHENKVLYEAQTRVQQKADALDQGVVQLGTNLAFVEKRVGEYQSMVETWESKPPLAPEDILIAANPIQAQILDAVAEDHAIEDTMYMLGKALDDGKIDGAVFLKTIRSLAKEQFLQRALVQKCAKALSG
ncbi:hypothetical protein AMAG_18025 [Allomyces macrogynus ATCC 38327]|uniref:SB domain-containing protein n=1 Tax=Allomyces macrogynus (strain ATCC 38327) TaxID=578462 RepID=A0A0L0S3X4_ALLM3|nr:hypothetical protein AMAG_18025 [Allomyces macrogynus ATCC 38327]|eukprot:KNE57252.1 hypothetical protein AMAG_18025 [Allomyces macrogynus ATCC 38327]